MVLPNHMRSTRSRSIDRDLTGMAREAGALSVVPTNNQAGRVRRGEEIFEGTDYPREWEDFVGQDMAKQQLQAQITSATARSARLDHTLFASGAHGIGKTTLAHLLAHKADVGIVQATGPIDLWQALALIQGMNDKDVLFIDEAHTLVAGGRNKADWLLPFMTEGRMYTEHGVEDCPDVTIVAATTDGGKLPETVLSRFLVKPRLVAYNDAESALIARSLATRMNVAVEDADLPRIAVAASGNPRDMRSILTALRDLTYSGTPDLGVALEWAGFSHDGLTLLAQEILVILLHQKNYVASIDSIGSMLSEPGPLRHHETALLQRGYLSITGKGRQLTATGVARAKQLKETI